MSVIRDRIYIDGQDETDKVERFAYQDGRYLIVFKKSNKPFFYGKGRIKILKTALSSQKAYDVFKYLKAIASTVGLKTEEGDNILERSYASIKEIPKTSALSSFLSGSLTNSTNESTEVDFFPFGFNLSQRSAVNKAFSNQLSVIEGPPGTGKTQTILNIIANAVLRGKSVAVVSSNNAATKNVYEKLEKHGIEFMAALLGSTQNKKEFIDSQREIPDLKKFQLNAEQEAVIKSTMSDLFIQLTENLSNKNELALLKREAENMKTEYEHFKQAYSGLAYRQMSFKQKLAVEQLLGLWIGLEGITNKQRRVSLFEKIIFWFKYGVKDWTMYDYPVEELILLCQGQYYSSKINDLSAKMESLENSLSNFAFENKMNEYTGSALQVFKSTLYNRYKQQKRKKYAITDLRHQAEDFIQQYPVIMSTTYSLRQSLSANLLYDYVIIDEASQVDLATGALALSCAKSVVIVGDTKQLPNVVNDEMQRKTDLVFDNYRLKEAYRYSKNSLLSAVLELFPNGPNTLLREHYRCHPKIIEFCNKKFYHNQLIVHTEAKSERPPLMVYKTAPGNHARGRMNQRQIDIIRQEIIPNEKLQNVDLGIVTPYRNQTNALQSTFQGTAIKADTVDKFQGRENDVIIISTVDNEISAFTDNPNRLNVAVSRAIDQLILVVNGNE